MAMQDKIDLDLDKDRILTIVSEAYRICKDVLQTDFQVSLEDLLSKVKLHVDSNRVAIPIRLDFPNRKYPGLTLELNLRREKIFARIPSRARNHPKQVLLNRFLKAL